MTIEELLNIITSNKPSVLIKDNEEEIFKLIPELEPCKGFDQHSDWHIYDIYEHILHVLDYTDNSIELRLTALFHDLGKPKTFHLDEKGGHFPLHWEESNKIFLEYAKKYNLPEDLTNLVSNLILYHDINISKQPEDKKKEIYNNLGKEGIELLFEFKKADLLAQNSKFHHPLLENLDIQKEDMISKHK